ncbi:SusC/RagA family TonB-linked outer membrane protein [Xanthovirga aplysinae]|uniref:SusC/RagA family TonB-linked outer membrane protein n=1 Tax=Xanthovirga aplysinae TaxID=2529853 RepID=UPI0012BD23FD|nr:SusC/RagA family TonB-linked outer membrane protein [Xanthovirga aplysinae]MTI30396.1 SusC/RagA family TonB-linked outer membrane protein [Xanthovirga aplysinae]
MKKQLQIILLMPLVLLFGLANAQDRLLSGRVVSQEDGEPLPGVNVTLKGTTVGTVTDFDGRYKLKVSSPDELLVFSFIGMEDHELKVGNRSVIDVEMLPDVMQLKEVMVTGLGIEAEKRTLPYAAQNVIAEDIIKSRETNIVNALAGKVAGVQINNSGGQAGSSSRIVIRGTTSLTGNNQPLWVIDGIPVDNRQTPGLTTLVESTLFNGTGSNRAIDIDPSLIDKVTVLSGASATAIYGSRGANGVIQIITKKGKASGKFPRVELSSSVGFDEAIIKGFQSSYLQGYLGAYRNGLPVDFGGYSELDGLSPQTSISWGPHKDSVSQDAINAVGIPEIYDPRKEFYRRGTVLNNSLTIGGGDEKGTYLLSYSNLNQEGIVPGNEFKRNSFVAKFETKLSKLVDVSTSINYINSKNSRLSEGNGPRSYLFALNFWPISHDITNYYTDDGTYYSYYGAFNNPFWLAENNGNYSDVDRFIITQIVGFEILPGIKLTNRTGWDGYSDLRKEQVNVGTFSIPDGRMYESQIGNNQINNDLMLTVEREIIDKIGISALLGHNVNIRKFKRNTIRGLGLSIPDYFDITNAEETQSYALDEDIRTVGVYANAVLDYDNYVFLTLTGRNDWSSTLPNGKNSYFYPSVGLGFVFTEVLGLAETNYFPYGKLRMSWAQAGNDAPAYLTTQTFTQVNPGDGTRGNISFPTNGLNGFELSDLLANNELKHELITEMEGGVDLRFFNGRVGLDATYYHKVSKNQIISQEISAASGI